MQWWNDLWLNEGFAKFMEFVSTNITYPELQVVRLSGLHLYIVVRLAIWTPIDDIEDNAPGMLIDLSVHHPNC